MTNRLHKSRSNRVVAGVCGGLGEYFAVDPTLVRLLFVLLTIFQGVGILAYIVMWIVMPEEKTADLPPRDAMKENFNRIRDDVERFGDQFRGGTTRPAATETTQAETTRPDTTRAETVGDVEAGSSPETTETALVPAQSEEAGRDVDVARPVDTYGASEPWTSEPRASEPATPGVDGQTAASRQMFAGVLLLIIGGLMLLSNLNIFWWFNWGRMWPLILVAIGAWLLYDRSRTRTRL